MNYISKSVLVLVLPMLFPNWNFLFSFFKYFKNYFSSSRQLLKYCSLCSFLQAPLEPCIVLNGMDRLVFLYHLIWKSIYIYIYVYIYSLLRMNQSLIPEFNCAALAILLC